VRPTPLDEIRQAIHGRWLSAATASPVNIEQATIDTRTAAAGDLFIAITGATHDGHAFLPAAAEAGCVSAVVRMDTPVDDRLAARYPAGIIGVADTTVALGELARMHRKRLTGQVVAVTGSVGKTTVKRMIHRILAGRLTGTVAPKSFNNEIGVPLTLLAASASDDYVVCELGAGAPGQIAALSQIALPDLAVITAVGPSHLAAFGSVEKVAAEKAAILTALSAAGVAVVHADSEPLQRALVAYDARWIRFGEADDAELRLTGWEPGALTQRFQVNDHLWVELVVPGRHNALNALAAMAVAMRFGFDASEAAAALAEFQPPPMRMQAQVVGPVTLINDAYNANPMSMDAALAVLVGLNVRRRVFVAGDMLELGAGSRQYHRELGERIARSGVDLLITIGPMARHIAEAAREGGLAADRLQSYDTAADGADAVESWLRDGDGVLVKASRCVAAECVAQRIVELAGPMGAGE